MAAERVSPDPAVAAFAASVPGLPVRERRVEGADGVSLHVVEAGPPDGRPLFLLHGFPEFWWGWRRQMPALAAAGRRVIVPDLRGYNRSGKPAGIAAYAVSRLARDLLALFDDAGVAEAQVAAHDWGGALAWAALERYPDRFDRLLVLNAPTLGALKRALLTSADQRRRGSYLFYFQLPILPERRIARAGFRAFRSIFKRSSPPGTFTPEELEVYTAAAAVPGALTAMLHWYRAALWFPMRIGRRTPRDARHGAGSLTGNSTMTSPSPVDRPVRLVWGTDDVALPEALIEPTLAAFPRAEVVRIEGAGHWVTHTAAGRVEAEILDFLR